MTIARITKLSRIKQVLFPFLQGFDPAILPSQPGKTIIPYGLWSHPIILLRFLSYPLRSVDAPDAQMQGANAEILLSPTVFSIQKAIIAKYSCYAAQNEEDHAKIVIGHEIGHVLMSAMRQQTGVDWAENYEQQVRRYCKVIKGNRAPEEEAVTQLSLAVLGRDYSFALEEDEFETNYIRLWEIHRWTANILNALRMMK